MTDSRFNTAAAIHHISVFAGSVFAALRAGMNDATSAVMRSATTAPAITRASVVLTLYSIDSRDLAATIPTTPPMTMPTAASVAPQRRTSCRMSRGRAPMASRVPISRVRKRTACESTP